MEVVDDLGADAEMGPGMDLILSLLAVTILILASSILDQEQLSAQLKPDAIHDGNMTTTDAESDVIDKLQVEIEALRNQSSNLATQRDDWRDAEKQSREQEEELRKQIVELRHAANGSEQEEALESSSIVRLEEELSASRRAESIMQQTVSELKHRLALSEVRSSEAEPSENRVVKSNAATNNRVVLRDSSGLSVFEPGSATLTSRGRRSLELLLTHLSGKVAEVSATVISVAGHSSPEPFVPGRSEDKLDANLELSVRRAITIANQLRQWGFPEQCLMIEGFGRSRSSTVADALDGKSLKLSYWDRQWQRSDEETKNVLSKEFPDQRRVEIIAFTDKASLCRTRQVQRALREVIKTVNSK